MLYLTVPLLPQVLRCPIFTPFDYTDVACTWNQDFVKKIKPDKIANIKLYSQKAINNSRKSEPKTISFSGTHTKPQNENIDWFLLSLSKLKCKPVILHCCKHLIMQLCYQLIGDQSLNTEFTVPTV